ncbi:YhgE/Pip domain-containing protein [Promicromonospora sp. NPDC090134]|uniref:YhgE/Pip domain-containing protein n=1 Tax=Promicromonospora sp. NPDC090134 TaxID=3364408 RepID=UPI00380DD639
MHPTARIVAHPRTWAVPIVFLVGLAVLFPAVYLFATVDPQKHLTDLPVALVIEEQTIDSPPSAAGAVADAIEDGAGTEIAFTRMTPSELADGMGNDTVAGAVVIPADFDQSIASLLPGSDTATVPTVDIRTNAGDGGLSGGLVTGNLAPVLRGVASGLGAQLAASAGGDALPAANQALLATPFDVVSAPYAELPANAGLGTSAFYYALVLVLLGFVGASMISPIVDSALGFAPSEVGPLVQRRPYIAASRLQTLLAKFGILLAGAPVAALAAQLVAVGPVGIPVSDPVTLWLFSTATIMAIGTSAMTVFAIFGNGIGALVNTMFFIALSMTSSGGTVPLAATPTLYRWLSEFEPFRAVVDGVRALLYFSGNPDAGLTEAWVRVAIGGAIGILLGITITALYGRVRMFTRHPHLEPSTTT